MLAAGRLLECRERNGYLLVADAEVLADIDDGRGHFAVWFNEDIFYRPEVLACAVVDLLVDVLIGSTTDGSPGIWGTPEESEVPLHIGRRCGRRSRRSDGSHRASVTRKQVPKQPRQREQRQHPVAPVRTPPG